MIAILSTENSYLPPACPTQITTSGLTLSIFSKSFFADFLNTVGICNFTTSIPSILEMKDKNGVIKAQIPQALILLVLHIVVMYFFAF